MRLARFDLFLVMGLGVCMWCIWHSTILEQLTTMTNLQLDQQPTANANGNKKCQMLVVFDYDWSLVNDNSDLFVFQSLWPQLLLDMKTLRASIPSWTELIDHLMTKLAQNVPQLTPLLIEQTLAKIPIQPGMLDALKLASHHANTKVVIVSDANTVFIESMLKHYALLDQVAEIHSNGAHYEHGNRLRVTPYHPIDMPPHGCELCPPNMCKGRILNDILKRNGDKNTRVVYIGDGSGDFCPSTRLSSNDIVLARKAQDENNSFQLLQRIHANQDKVQARVIEWSTGRDVLEVFTQEFGSSTTTH